MNGETALSFPLVDFPDMAEQAFETLRNEIITGRLAPGARLVVVEQAQRLGVSRTPVKEALNRLVAQELVVDIQRKGFFVSHLDAQGIAELAELRLVLELAAVERGIEIATTQEIAEMRRVLGKMEALVDASGRYSDFVAYTTEDFHLHLLMVATAHNERMVTAYRNLNTHAFTVRAHYTRSPEDRSATRNLRRHQAMVEAFATRDLESLKDTLTENILSMGQVLGTGVPESDVQRRLQREIQECRGNRRTR